jgi:hypothetical protein
MGRDFYTSSDLARRYYDLAEKQFDFPCKISLLTAP